MIVKVRDVSRRLLGGASLTSLCVLGVLAPVASASATDADTLAAAASSDDADSSKDVVVTGTRVVRDGYRAPTPTTVIGGEEIERSAKINVSEMLWQMPALAGMTKTNTTTVSAGQVGIQAPNLRNLGITRTLVLLDGQRIPPATTGMLSDLNTIPNTLVKRVDVVNGGASARYGSDAVGGVVNFITDSHFKGLKGNVRRHHHLWR